MASKAAPSTKDDGQQSSGGSKAAANTRPQEQALKCPRCDSPNTKFCYYNNYSLSQPRHFCKTCRRYWTRGGALRSVPIGGGCRKNKKLKSSSSSSTSRLSAGDSTASSDIGAGGFNFFNTISPVVDFQLGGGGGGGGGLNFPATTGLFNHFSAASPVIPSSFTLDPPALNFSSFPSMLKRPGEINISTSVGFQEMGISSNLHHDNNNNLASSIESLSSINQELHWKLQQQRLAMIFGGDQNHKEIISTSAVNNSVNMIQKPQPILFQNLEISKPAAAAEDGNNLATEWLFDNATYAHGNGNGNGNANATENSSNWNGFQAWSSSSNINQYTSLP